MSLTFENIYQIYHPKVYRLCLGYVNDEDWAKDLMQETFISVWKNLPNFRGDSNVGTWIYRIAVNNCLRQIDRKKKKENQGADFKISEVAEPIVDNSAQIVFLRKCIAELKEIDRVIITMTLEEISQKEIAEVLGISEGNVRVKVHRIKENLAKRFKHHG